MSVRSTHRRGGIATVEGGAVEARSPTGGLRGSVAGSVAGKAAEMVTLVLLATVVPRSLGPEDYGTFAVPLTIVTIGSLALTLGGPTLMARYVPAAPAAERVALARALGVRLARGRALQLGVLALLAVASVVWNPDRFPAFEVGVVVVALSLNVAATLALQMGLGLGRTGAWSFRYPLQNGVLVLTALALHPLAGARGAIGGIVIAGAVSAAFAAGSTRSILWASPPPVAVPDGAIRFGALQAGGAALVQFAQRGGVLAVALLAGSTVETGYAALAIGIALGATYAVLQAFTVALPHLSDHGAAAGGEAAEALLRRLAGGSLVALVPAAALAAAALDPIVPAVFGAEYAAATSAFAPAVALVVLAPLNALAVQVAALRLRPEAALASGIASAAAFVAVALLAVPAWGAAGGTAAALAGASAGGLSSVLLLPGAVGSRVAVASFAGAATVLAVAAIT